MRLMLLVPALLCGACGGAAMTAADSGGGATVWWTTCGPPACAGDAAIPDSGLPYCPLQQAGSACATPGAECDPYARCTGPLLCSTTDPKGMPPECPISRASSKKDIRFLSSLDLRAYSRELIDLPLATFRYRGGDERTRLGFLIDGHESLACVDGDHVDLYGYTSMAVAALKVQEEEIAHLRAEVAAMRKELARKRR